MLLLKNVRFTGSKNRESLIDFHLPRHFNGEIILFIHGYMGFKDWGAWNLLEKYFTDRQYGFCKFNMSHNGGTVDNGIDFPDPAAFAENNYSTERNDVSCVLNWIATQVTPLPAIHLLGHSRGGGIALLSAADHRVSSVMSLAGISSVEQRFEGAQMLADWQSQGVKYVTNQRTKQNLPLNYSQYVDFVQHRDQLNIEQACQRLQKPVLLIHGEADTSVPIAEGEQLSQWLDVPLHRIAGADHVFGSMHPWESDQLPVLLERVGEEVLAFLGSF